MVRHWNADADAASCPPYIPELLHRVQSCPHCHPLTVGDCDCIMPGAGERDPSRRDDKVGEVDVVDVNRPVMVVEFMNVARRLH